MIHGLLPTTVAHVLAHLTIGTRKILGYLDFDIAKVALSSLTLSLPLVRIFGFACSWRTTLQSAVPVMRHEGLAFILLC